MITTLGHKPYIFPQKITKLSLVIGIFVIGLYSPTGTRDLPHLIQLLEVLPYQRTTFTLGEPVSLVKVFRLFKLEQMFFWVFRVWTQKVDVQHLIYWQGQRVCDDSLLYMPKLHFRMRVQHRYVKMCSKFFKCYWIALYKA